MKPDPAPIPRKDEDAPDAAATLDELREEVRTVKERVDFLERELEIQYSKSDELLRRIKALEAEMRINLIPWWGAYHENQVEEDELPF